MKSIFTIVAAIICFHSMVHGNKETRLTRSTISDLKYIKDEGALNSCMQPSNRIMSFCNMSYSVPSSYMRGIAKQMDFIVDYINTRASSFTPQCLFNTKEVLCKGLLPKCSSNLTTASYLTITQPCLSLTSCPNGIFTTISRTPASLCNLSGRQFSLNTCVSSRITSLSPGICGTFPNVTVPPWAVPILQRQGASVLALRVGYNLLGVSSDCINRWTKFACQASTACNATQDGIITFGWSREECTAAVNCLPDAIKTPTAGQLDCNIYPSSSGASPLSLHYTLIAVILFLATWINYK
ncbi:uncharacterized protein TRIADDRAFT_61336 [Trichoplax adhaerens]|uniref:FZ domain-containing protein n=1 Tax=Trichoplax adhaerens TaxID=10228 RepID=B3SAP9_TRIAD|nr:predicted protein [Trichoplax adhaerens]EDV20140.1 predicted protein [Trichoplax adhaerens]|eukprot:XP_002117301.1 predicted protein [Trichoplax adhaerens]